MSFFYLSLLTDYYYFLISDKSAMLKFLSHLPNMEILRFLANISATSGSKKISCGQIKDICVRNILSQSMLSQK